MFLSINRALRKARRHAEKGETDLAVLKYASVLEKHPDNREAAEGLKALQQKNSASPEAGSGPLQEQLNELVTLWNQGSLQEAYLKGEALAEQFPDVPNIPNLLGGLNISMGRMGQAIASFSRALQIDPDFAEAHNNMGNALNATGKHEEALTSFKRALQSRPDFVEALNNLGNTLNALERYEEAIECCSKALQIRTDIAELHNTFGNALEGLGEYEDAVTAFRQALQIDPNSAEAHNNLGNALFSQGKLEEALACYEQATRINPNFAEALNHMGNTLNSLGRSEEALPICNKVLMLRPDYAEAHRNLSNAKKYQQGDPQIEQMLRLLERKDIPGKDRMLLGYALAKAFGDTGDYDKAFLHLSEANKLRKEDVAYDISSDRELFAQIKNLFSEDVPTFGLVRKGDGGQANQPVFIVGLPRSGTSLIEQILASHSQVYGAGELKLMGQSIQSVTGNSWKLAPGQLEAIRKSYFSGLAKIGASEPFITDKMPLNLLFLGHILSAMPEAKVIHAKRDARATCWANFKIYFAEKGHGFAYDLHDIVEYYKMYIDLMSFWHAKYPGRIYDLNYEALTENQEEETRKLLDYVGLDWEERCLDFHENKRMVRTASVNQVRKAMYQGSSEEWRKYEKHLGFIVESLKDF